MGLCYPSSSQAMKNESLEHMWSCITHFLHFLALLITSYLGLLPVWPLSQWESKWRNPNYFGFVHFSQSPTNSAKPWFLWTFCNFQLHFKMHQSHLDHLQCACFMCYFQYDYNASPSSWYGGKIHIVYSQRTDMLQWYTIIKQLHYMQLVFNWLQLFWQACMVVST